MAARKPEGKSSEGGTQEDDGRHSPRADYCSRLLQDLGTALIVKKSTRINLASEQAGSNQVTRELDKVPLTDTQGWGLERG